MCSGSYTHVDDEEAHHKPEQLKEGLVRVGVKFRGSGMTLALQQMLQGSSRVSAEEMVAALKVPRSEQSAGTGANEIRQFYKALSARRARNKAARKARRKQR